MDPPDSGLGGPWGGSNHLPSARGDSPPGCGLWGGSPHGYEGCPTLPHISLVPLSIVCRDPLFVQCRDPPESMTHDDRRVQNTATIIQHESIGRLRMLLSFGQI